MNSAGKFEFFSRQFNCEPEKRSDIKNEIIFLPFFLLISFVWIGWGESFSPFSLLFYLCHSDFLSIFERFLYTTYVHTSVCMSIYPTRIYSTVKSRFNEWPRSAHFDSLNWDFTLNRDFLMWNSILVTSFCTLNRDITLNRDSLNRDSLNRDFTVLYIPFSSKKGLFLCSAAAAQLKPFSNYYVHAQPVVKIELFD